MLSCQLMQAFFLFMPPFIARGKSSLFYHSLVVKTFVVCMISGYLYIHPLPSPQNHTKYDKVEPPKTNSGCKTNTMYHMHTFGSLFYHSLVVKNVCVYDIRLVIYWPPSHPLKTTQKYDMVETPKTNIDHKTNTVYHLHTLGASKCMHVCGTQ